jgi:tricorn protease
MNLLPGGADQLVNFTISPETSELAVRDVPAARALENILPSPTGDRIALGARGDVLVFDPATGTSKNLTNTPGIAERYPTISPDGKLIAYTSDESGEYALHIRSLENDTVKKIAIEQRPSFYWNLAWSPDSKKIVFNDRRLAFWMIDVPTGTTTKVDTSTYTGQDFGRRAFRRTLATSRTTRHLRTGSARSSSTTSRRKSPFRSLTG